MMNCKKTIYGEKMSLIEWEPVLSVNVKSIDDQHKKLISMVNQLHDAMKSGKAKEIMGGILSELIDYTDKHFKHEEAYFEKHNYPGFLRHKKEHDDLRKTATDLKKKFDSGETLITVEVLYFLKDWLSKHILGSDKEYTPFLNAKGVV